MTTTDHVYDEVARQRARIDVALAHPDILEAIAEGGSFGGDYSVPAATHMFSTTHGGAIEDLRAKTTVIEVAPRCHSVRLPIVNATVFDTDEGFVVVDTAMGPGGPALRDAIATIGDAPIHTIVYTHAHVDHAYGTWALVDADESPEVVAHERALDRFRFYQRLRGSLAKYMNQPSTELPRSPADVVWPTRTFTDRLELTIGGEDFHLVHHPGETDDQCYVWVPGRGALASADYYQGFLPNLGNGKRTQRGTDEWVEALREMAALEPSVLLPGHGAPSTDPDWIRSELTMLADALAHIIDHTIDGLNQGLRKDQIVDRLTWPEPYASHPTLQIRYVTPEDICRMVLKRWTGWWDDIPSHWAPAPLAAHSRELVDLAGGVENIARRARELAATDLRLACHLADHAWYADHTDPVAQQLVIDIYRQRLLDPSSNTQDRLVYLDHMADAHAAASSGHDHPGAS